MLPSQVSLEELEQHALSAPEPVCPKGVGVVESGHTELAEAYVGMAL